MKRVKIQPKKPINALFEKWLFEWKKEAADHGLQKQHVFGKALRSLQKFPLPVRSGQDCIILENFGAKLCEMLDKALNKYRRTLTDSEWESIMTSSLGLSASTSTLNLLERDKATPRKIRNTIGDPTTSNSCKSMKPATLGSSEYVPKYRSGGYAILVALFHGQDDAESMTKATLLKASQEHCDASFTKPMPGTHYTAWSTMAVLVKKNLVIKEGRPMRFKLTEEGLSLAKRLANLSEDDINKAKASSASTISESAIAPKSSVTDDIIVLDDDGDRASKLSYVNPQTEKSKEELEYVNERMPSSENINIVNDLPMSSQQSSQDTQPFETFFLFPGTFKIILLVDVRETESRTHTKSDVTIQGLERRGVLCETRHLTAGDFVWVAQDSSGAELVLPYIVERKRLDDLSSSIKDGRFHEQKFRLKGSGVQNIIYLLEKHGNDCHRLGLPLPTLQQAAANTQVVDEFIVKVCKSHEDSMLYLSCLTKLIIRHYKDKTLMSCPKQHLKEIDLSSDLISLMPFKQFIKESTKTKRFTVKEMLVKHLVQLKGMSVEKAFAIAEKHSTPSALVASLKKDGEKAIADLHVGPLRRLGPAIAKSVHQLYTMHTLS